jgi:hypothetical protein
MLQMKVPKEELDGDPAMLCKFCRGMQLCWSLDNLCVIEFSIYAPELLIAMLIDH